MKALIRDYLASLKEREELDAMLPDLLSELGFNVISRPRRGTTQRGVDVAAVGPDEGEQKLFLFSVKPGDLTRATWNGPEDQALRPSLDEILDGYLHGKIFPRHKKLKVVICLCIGGEIREDVKDLVAGYFTDRTTDRVSFDEWNGDRLASHLLGGVLREELLPRPLRSSFQKAVAMVDEPDVSHRHFRDVARQVLAQGTSSIRQRLRAGRLLSLCAWIIFVWCRDVGNVEAAYRVSETALLYAWELRRPTLGSRSKDAAALGVVTAQLIELHLRVGSELLEVKVLPHVATPDGLSSAVHALKAVDVNLSLFEILGRLGVLGVWAHWAATLAGRQPSDEEQASLRRYADAGLAMIEANPILFLPIADHQAVDIALFLQLCLCVGVSRPQELATWLGHMENRLSFTLQVQDRYPTCSENYGDLVGHPRERTDDYFKEATAGSTLIPLLAAWLATLAQSDELADLCATVEKRLAHCTLQGWTPGANSEDHLYLNDDLHGVAICDLALEPTGVELLATLKSAVDSQTAVDELSAVKAGHWPLVLVACRHYRLPVPPRFWLDAMHPLPPYRGAAAAVAGLFGRRLTPTSFALNPQHTRAERTLPSWPKSQDATFLTPVILA